jgi:Tol biopolymer transport system component
MGSALSLGSPRLAVARLRPASALCALLATGCSLALASLALAPSAHASYGPLAGGFGADIVSVDNASDEQANAPTADAVISADGRYVLFQTRATNFFEDDGGVEGPHGLELDAEPAGTLREGGIFRYDHATGEIQLVADGSEIHSEGPEAGKLIFRGAQNPSVSADGRYVAFSTAQQLVPQDKNENIDVYVRDMDVPLTAARKDSGAYALVSAKSGGEEAASYAPRNPPLPGDTPGAEVWPNTSISADGRDVVFRTTELESDLPDHSTIDAPPGQLFVRDLQAKTTTLLSRDSTTVTHSSGDPAGGAIGPATISADGSTVAWVSTNAEAQTRFLPGESPVSEQPYYLWRRWQEPGAVTRRVTGIADPEDPECPGGEAITLSQTAEGPCYGPLSEQEATLASIAGVAPGLSANGYAVAFLAGAALRPNITKPGGLDVFLTSMLPGVTRKQGTRELTLAASTGNPGASPSIESLALSQDGSTIAFTSPRDSFVLPEPQPIGVFRPSPTASDLYLIHLGEDTLERAVLSDEGGDPNGSIAVNPTLSEDGSTVAFASSSSNLIFGDANGVSNAFTVTREAAGGTAPPPVEFNATQGGFSLSASNSPELGLSVKRATDGGLLLLVETPAAGKLTAKAEGSITTKAGKRTHKQKVTLARVSGATHAEGTATLVLRVAAKYAKDLASARKLKTLITVGFIPPPPLEVLSAEANATFLATNAKKARVTKVKGHKKD